MAIKMSTRYIIQTDDGGNLGHNDDRWSSLETHDYREEAVTAMNRLRKLHPDWGFRLMRQRVDILKA